MQPHKEPHFREEEEEEKKNSGGSKLNPAAHELGAIPALSANVESGRILSFGEKKSSGGIDRQSQSYGFFRSSSRKASQLDGSWMMDDFCHVDPTIV